MSPSNPSGAGGSGGMSTGKTALIVGGALVAILGVAGLVFAVSRNDASSTIDSVLIDDPDPEPEISTTVAPTDDTEVPAVTEPDTPATEPDTPSTEPDTPSTEPDTTLVTVPDQPAATLAPGVTVVPDSDFGDGVPLDSVGQLLAWTSFSSTPLDDAGQQSMIESLISTRQVVAVAHPTAVSAICAGIPVDVDLSFDIVWEFGGDEVSRTPVDAAPPGAGGCIENGDDPLPAGSYQVYALGTAADDVGYATTFVVGANEVAQSFVNNSDVDICDIGLGPIDTGFYELFVSRGGPIPPGDTIIIDVASVEYDLRAASCDGDVLGDLSFLPDAFSDQPLAP